MDQGLGGTYQQSGFHEGMNQDKNLIIPANFVTMQEVVTGADMTGHIENPWLRWHKSFEDYPSFLADIDDYALHKTDNFERFKRYTPLKKHVVGSSPIIPRQDNDEKFSFYDIQGESLYSHPPNPNNIIVDHGMDEEHIWAFGRSLYNQHVVKNQWSNFGDGYKNSFAPFWGEKLSMPAWYKKDKMNKFYRHWNHRLGLEMIKMDHIRKFGSNPTEKQREFIKTEIANFISKCYDHEDMEMLNDVYVTDHQVVEPKLNTHNEEEDNEFFDYQKSIEDYNADDSSAI